MVRELQTLVVRLEALERKKQDDMADIKARLENIDVSARRNVSPKTRNTHRRVLKEIFDNRCPLCGDPIKGTPEIGHFFGPRWNKRSETWPLCRDCHRRLTHKCLPRTGDVRVCFEHYQAKVKRVFRGGDDQLDLFG